MGSLTYYKMRGYSERWLELLRGRRGFCLKLLNFQGESMQRCSYILQVYKEANLLCNMAQPRKDGISASLQQAVLLRMRSPAYLLCCCCGAPFCFRLQGKRTTWHTRYDATLLAKTIASELVPDGAKDSDLLSLPIPLLKPES
jgi:hypothetical protein